LLVQVQRPFPRRIIGVEKKGADVRTKRTIGWLEDLVRQAVAKFGAAAAGFGIIVIEIAIDMHRLVVHSVTIQDDAAMTRHAAEKPGHVQVTDTHQSVTINAAFFLVSAREKVQIPFKDEDDGVGRFQVERTLEW